VKGATDVRKQLMFWGGRSMACGTANPAGLAGGMR
jgi:hypothetical protein